MGFLRYPIAGCGECNVTDGSNAVGQVLGYRRALLTEASVYRCDSLRLHRGSRRNSSGTVGEYTFTLSRHWRSSQELFVTLAASALLDGGDFSRFSRNAFEDENGTANFAVRRSIYARFALLDHLDCADAITANSAEHASALVRSGSRSAMQESVHEDSEVPEEKAILGFPKSASS